MPVDDLWYLSARGTGGQRLKSKRHGRGKRWRVRYRDTSGAPRERLFERKADADAWDASARTGLVLPAPAGKAEQRITFREYAERWRLSREPGWVVETRRRVTSNLRHHLYPEFGDRTIRAITLTAVLEWLGGRLAQETLRSSLKLYFELLDAVLHAAVIDKVLGENPCDGVKLGQILRGLTRVPKWVPTEQDVRALLEVVPDRYRAAIWLGAGQGLRLCEALGIEAGPRCVDFPAGELHVVQQLRYAPSVYGGFYLTEPKAGSSGTVDLDPVVAQHLTEHLQTFPPAEIELTDITTGDPTRRPVPLLFTTTHGNPINDKTWSREWARWREAAGWPKQHGTFHALRHFFATTLITNHVEPKVVQWLLRHKSLQITLETYVHWWPTRTRSRGVVGTVLQGVDHQSISGQDQG